MADKFIGEWKPVENHNLEEYFSKLGVGSLKQRAVKSAHQIFKQDKNDSEKLEIIMKIAPGLSKQQNFKLGSEFDDKDPEGNKVKLLATFEADDKLVVRLKYIEKDRKQVIIRQVTGDQMKMDMELFEGQDSEIPVATCNRVFARK